ncbi:ricin-type beta-trefoil lectin domain protein [Streptomyces sp. enrichment culture]|uniref:RICIN domain-containing protein n=1 Tax=Streptomyces sp. enrichment culture TaxID=1795815 RepID=UPI003F55A1CC
MPPTPHPPRPPYPPPAFGRGDAQRGAFPGESDESLAGRLRGGSDTEVSRSTALLVARHWRSAHEYAVICLADAGPAASMVTAAAVHQLLDRLTLGEPGVALRPRLLTGVRDTVRLWAAEDRISAVLPGLRKPAGGRGMRAAASLMPENRRLVERAFQSLPRVDQCLLWHTEVEAEAVSVPAALLGMDAGLAAASVEQAREKLREGCVRAHRELAPTKECRFHNRLLDVPMRRGGALLPDVRRHLDECGYCRAAAEQLSYFDGGLGDVIAEAVLGWGARRYVDSRPGRVRPAAVPRRSARHGAPRVRGGTRRRLPRTAADGRSPRALLTGVGLASAGLLAVLVGAGMWDGDGGAEPMASTGAPSPGEDSASPPAAPHGSAGMPTAPRRSALFNVGANRCLDIAGPPRAGAGVQLAECSSAGTQLWSYTDDGRLLSAAAPALCLDSHMDAGVVILAGCADAGTPRADDVRYDLTEAGEFLPRWDDRLALAVAADDIVVKVRDGSRDQRWSTTRATASVRSASLPHGEPQRP